jgi:hypothetical protein
MIKGKTLPHRKASKTLAKAGFSSNLLSIKVFLNIYAFDIAIKHFQIKILPY